MNSWKGTATIGVLCLIVIAVLPLFLTDPSFQDEENGYYDVNEEPEAKARVLFDSNSPSQAILKKASNYHDVYDATDIVIYKDNWWISYTKFYVLNVKFDEYLYDGDVVIFYGRLIGNCPERKILLTAPDDPYTIYGEYEFHDASSWWFNITLDIEDEITEFDVVIHYSCNNKRDFIIDYISFERMTDMEYWRDEGGSIITKYHVAFDYQINTSSRVDPSTIRLEVEANSSIVTPAGTSWMFNHGSFYEIFPTESYQRLRWESRWVSLPPYHPPFCMWNTEEYGDDDYTQCDTRTQLNITVDVTVRVYGKLYSGEDYVIDIEIEQNIRNYPIYWY